MSKTVQNKKKQDITLQSRLTIKKRCCGPGDHDMYHENPLQSEKDKRTCKGKLCGNAREPLKKRKRTYNENAGETTTKSQENRTKMQAKL